MTGGLGPVRGGQRPARFKGRIAHDEHSRGRGGAGMGLVLRNPAILRRLVALGLHATTGVIVNKSVEACRRMNVTAIALLSSASVMVLVDGAAGQNTREEALDVIRDLEIRASESLSRIPRIRSRSEAESATISIKHKLLQSFGFDRIGGDPTAAPIGHIVGTLGRRGYRIDKVVFESFPGHFVAANVYYRARGL